MKRSRFSEEQIIGILKEHEAGVSVAEKDHSVERPSGALQRGAVVILAIAFGVVAHRRFPSDRKAAYRLTYGSP